jgi:hypothetical protein
MVSPHLLAAFEATQMKEAPAQAGGALPNRLTTLFPKETSCSCVKRRQLRKLLACARQLGEIEQYVSTDR